MTGTHQRKSTPLVISLRTTVGVVAGAAVLSTAAVAAQAAVFSPGKAEVSAAAAAVQMPGERPRSASPAPKKAKAAKGRPAKKKPTAGEAIKVAKSQLGVEENGSGKTKFQDWYMSTDRAKETVKRDGGSVSGYSEAQWCDMFVSWVGEQVGFSDQVGTDAWTVAHAEWFKKQGRWGTEPKPGAIVFFSWSGDKSTDAIVHVGMVIKDNKDGTVETVEGNTSNAVKVRQRDTGSIVGYGYPEYAK
ncbi:CHAP domain-containing protein [Spirillospora sp. NBC_01491]|uniref:CHAP domain-containing protein n=1 Tax=Spirillospora sp. NBC_01491 TaxID=2976007 RepID=UPI002E32C47D|nr:CHAP domain-containing protein [Spirillospora sp. NBC_01491]